MTSRMPATAPGPRLHHLSLVSGATRHRDRLTPWSTESPVFPTSPLNHTHPNLPSSFAGSSSNNPPAFASRFKPPRCPLSSLSNIDDHLCFKYQLPSEDLDALISVTNDEDLNHMMLEYDRLHRSAARLTARLRVFSFVSPKKARDSPEVHRTVPIDESSNFDAIGFPLLHLRPPPLCCRHRTLPRLRGRCPCLDQRLVPRRPQSPSLTPPLTAFSAQPTPFSPPLTASSSSSAISAFPRSL